MAKKILIALPPRLLEKIDNIAYVESRTRSDLVRESLRRYIENFERTRTTIKQPSILEIVETNARAADSN